MLNNPATAVDADGVLVIDDTGDRKAGGHTDHVARQWIGPVAKVDNGIVAVSSLWADEHVYYPLHVRPYTPASRLPLRSKDAAFRTRPLLALELIKKAQAAGITFRAVVADCAYGDNVNFEAGLWSARLPYVVSLAPAQDPGHLLTRRTRPKRPPDACAGKSCKRPDDWTVILRHFRNGHDQTWWAADLTFSGYGPDRLVRLVVATTDPATLPAISTRYLTTNLPRPGSSRAAESTQRPADLAEVVRLYALRNLVEQGYKQVKHELGWADFMVRGDRAIRRHWQLVCCAFSFCWHSWITEEAAITAPPAPVTPTEASANANSAPPAGPPAGQGKNAGPFNTRTDHRVHYSYWRGVSAHGLELYPRVGNAAIVMPTHNEQTCVAVQWPVSAAGEVRADIERNSSRCWRRRLQRSRSACAPVNASSGSRAVPTCRSSIGSPMVRAGRWLATPAITRIRAPARAFLMRFGMPSCLSDALGSGFCGREDPWDAVQVYAARRDAASRPMYELTYKLTQLQPPSPAEQQLFGALLGNASDTAAFLGALLAVESSCLQPRLGSCATDVPSAGALLASAWSERTGLSQPMPTPGTAKWAQYPNWTRQVRIDLPALRAFAQAGYAETDTFLASLTDDALDQPLNLSGAGVGQQTVASGPCTAGLEPHWY